MINNVNEYLKAALAILGKERERSVVGMFPTSGGAGCRGSPEWGIIHETHARLIVLFEDMRMRLEEVVSR